MFTLKFNMLERCNLGVIVCDDLKIAEDMLRHSFYTRSNSIMRKCQNCSIDVKFYLFRTSTVVQLTVPYSG